MTAFACIFVSDFPVEALLRAEPELRSQAVAVLEGKVPLQKVFAANEKARRVGIEPGMSRLQIEACADLVLRVRSPLQEDAAHAALLDCAQSFSPRVEDAGCDTILLDLAGLEPLFGPLPKIAWEIARRASDLGLEANVAAAFNPDTAVLAARGFSGVTVIPYGREAEQLGSLPLQVLLAGAMESARLLETFDRWGVRNLRALAALPEVALSERLGQEGVRLQQLARGATSRTLVPVEPLLAFEEAIELEYPLVLLEPLAFLLGRLLEQLCARLTARSLATQELRLRLELENGYREEMDSRPVEADSTNRRWFQRTLRLPVPLLDAKVFLKLLQLDLKAHPPGAPIVKIHLAAEPVRLRAAQGGLFLPPSPEPEKLELTLARIASIVGEGKLGSLELLDTHRPEGFRMLHFAPSEPQGPKPLSKKALNAGLKPCSTQSLFEVEAGAGNPQKPSAENWASDFNTDGAVTAMRIFRPPMRATVTLRDGRPAHMVCPKRKDMQGEVVWMAGPWRSSGDWWAREGWARDEWDIAVQRSDGITLYRLVRDLMSGGWFVEGTYD
jgi:protein ImuB